MPAFTPFAESLRDYERWLKGRLRGDVWEQDLAHKHDRMRETAFVFLRATYWRWAETILTICPALAGAPPVAAVGDVHLENYGVWRDVEGRLTWGINDLDEAAEMPYAIDLVRLATSAILSRSGARPSRSAICGDVLSGYLKGLSNPGAFSLDEEHLGLRALFAVSEDERTRFWKKVDALTADPRVPRPYRSAILGRMPGDDAVVEMFARRRAGVGSLGRPRWVGVARWRGGRVVREAKAVVPSGWTRAHSRGPAATAVTIVGGRYRAPDPWYSMTDTVVVRRLSPNSRKIEGKAQAAQLVKENMLRAMGRELASIHLGGANVAQRIRKDLSRRGTGWLEEAAGTAAEFVAEEFTKYVRS